MIEEAIARPRAGLTGQRPQAAQRPPDTVSLSPAATCECREDLRGLDPQQRAAALAVEAIAGRRIRWVNFSAGFSGGGGATAPAPPAAGPAPDPAVAIRRTDYYAESEQTSFAAQGIVETADRRQIQFDVSLTMERHYESVTTRVIAPPPPPGASGKAKDPLVINYGAAPARLTEAKISFDLDSSGTPQSVSFVAEGSGFLMIDKNGDGKATNGTELFGPQSGDGFSELTSYDADGNGWIDEADPVYSQLRLWDQDGVSTLAGKGIGAIATASVETPFEYKDASNTLHANLRRTGIYLRESGEAGTVQHLDLVVS